MKIKDIVSFHDDRFFDGAVQLSWALRRREKAKLASESFVFHGPKYHGAEVSKKDSLNRDYQLKDTANFTLDLLNSIEKGINGVEVNPYWLIVAGYGSGKSHLALTLSEMLSNPNSETSKNILKHISDADTGIGAEVEGKISSLDKPVLILPLDGMSGFHLGNALNKAVFDQLKHLNIDTDPISSLSPRFKIAEDFVERNYEVRKDNFSEKFPSLSKQDICSKLRENDEDIYFLVDEIFTIANGNAIPVEGNESSQDLIDLLANYYCGSEGPFSNVIILFDEFGRYLEYAGDKPHLAGDSSLQQIFQGIQDNNEKIKFLGFIQYELKEYLKRFSGPGLRQLQRYITRFEASEKLYLSTNLETIFAHMVEKDTIEFEKLWLDESYKNKVEKTYNLMAQSIKAFNEFPVWSENEQFEQVIFKGCWPLHPLAVWFLSRQKDIVQSRSALSFIKESINDNNEVNIDSEKPYLSQISVAEIVLKNMLPELISAERDTGGVIAETVQTLLEKFDSYITDDSKLTLIAIAILEKLKLGKKQQFIIDELLSESTVLSIDKVKNSLDHLAELGALEWNSDLGKYELLTDGASRAQFQHWLRLQKSQVTYDDVLKLFLKKANVELSLKNIDTNFGLENDIKSTEWHFEASYANSLNIKQVIKNSFTDWKSSSLPKEAKGRVIYLYIKNENISEVDLLIQEVFAEELRKLKVKKAPIWIVGIHDEQALIAEKLIHLHVMQDTVNPVDEEKYRRFISSEIETSKDMLREQSIVSQKKQKYWVAGFTELLSGRSKVVAQRIFQNIYNRVIPFNFDGFTSTTGRGPKLNSDIARALIARQFNGTWIQSQVTDIRNRCNSVLMHSWQTIDTQGKVISPRNKPVREVLDRIVDIHKSNSNQNLLTTYQSLILPPYGLNASSASLIIGVFLGLETLQRRLEFSGEYISSVDWLSEVYKGNVRNFFNEDALKKTTIKFLPKNAESRWRELLDKWDFERNYSKKINYYKEAKVLWSDSPIPEVLEPAYNLLSSKTLEIQNEIKRVEDDIDKLGKLVEKVERNLDIKSAILAGRKTLKLKAEIENIEIWPEQYLNDCNNYINEVRTFIAPDLNNWIKRQNCTDVTQISDFRGKTQTLAQALKDLDFKNESDLLERQITSTINRVELLSQFNRILSESREYPLIPEATRSTTVRRLRDDIDKGDNLIKMISSADKVLNSDEINAIIGAIKEKQEKFRLAIKQKQNEMSVLFEAPQSFLELNTMLNKAEHLSKIFVGTPDEVEIQDIIFILIQMRTDINAWQVNDLPKERAEEVLSDTLVSNVKSLEVDIEAEDMEPPWSILDIYTNISNQLLSEIKRKSNDWINIYLKSLDGLTLSELLALKNELTNPPSFLSISDKEKLNSYLDMLDKSIQYIEAENLKVKVEHWISPYLSININSEMNKQDIQSILKEIKEPPYKLSSEDREKLNAVENKLLSILDEINTDELMARIKKLPKVKLKEIYKFIASLIS